MKIFEDDGGFTKDAWYFIKGVVITIIMVGILNAIGNSLFGGNGYRDEPRSSFLYKENALRSILIGCARAHDPEDHIKYGGTNGRWPYTPESIMVDTDKCLWKNGIVYKTEGNELSYDTLLTIFSVCVKGEVPINWYDKDEVVIGVFRCLIDNNIDFINFSIK